MLLYNPRSAEAGASAGLFFQALACTLQQTGNRHEPLKIDSAQARISLSRISDSLFRSIGIRCLISDVAPHHTSHIINLKSDIKILSLIDD
jgi:hypothetical protein